MWHRLVEVTMLPMNSTVDPQIDRQQQLPVVVFLIFMFDFSVLLLWTSGALAMKDLADL